jgi:hypothetical protein
VKQPTTQRIFDLFNDRIQFQVPVYQRAYIWNEADNWVALWDDIADTADRYLADPEAQDPQRHFLGPIVLDQDHSDPGGVDPRLVIDGQQRLTTLQVVIAAAAAVARERSAEDIAAELDELTFNRGRAAQGDLRFKVWPSRRDRLDFVATIEGKAAESSSGISQAWHFFHDQIDAWVIDGEGGADSQAARLGALQTCLDSLLYVVSINLDDSDNAQVIFETLNARGTGLGALDLVKNATFLQGEREGVATESLYDEWWEPTFEADDYWLEEIRQGREKRARADWFLMHWLAMELGRVVRADKLFDAFRKDILHGQPRRPMSDLVPRICEDARVMRSFDDYEAGTPEGLFFSRMETMDTTTMLPVALCLFREAELSSDRRLRALAALESWLVRRAILRLTSQSYNRTLTSLLKAIKGEIAQADEGVARELRSSQAATAIWPSDEEIRQRLSGGDLYGYVGRDRVCMILEACELDLRNSPKTEPLALPAGLSIEHAMPKAWEENWPITDSGDPQAATEDRDAHVNLLGNLTLVTQPLNSSMSNQPWLKTETSAYGKRDELARRSVLLINTHLCQHEHWDEEQIDQRGADLTERVLRTWPGPDSSAWATEAPATSAA